MAVVRALSLTIASVPVALPLVMNVMMAAGAHEMAKQKALVTHLSALQEIASMDVLCCDKTGTLTTAQITAFADRIQVFPPKHAGAAEVLAYAALASNPHNKVQRLNERADADGRRISVCVLIGPAHRLPQDDPIDAAMLNAYQAVLAGQQASDGLGARFQIMRFYPFNAVIKRTTVHAIDRSTGRRPVVAKGAVEKVLATGDDGAEGGTWTCEGAEAIRGQVIEADASLGRKGYKTLGVVRRGIFWGVVGPLSQTSH